MWILIGVFMVGGSLWSWYAPSCLDDYTYNKVPLNYTRDSFNRCDGRPVQSMTDAFDAIEHVMKIDNGRLANFVHILFTPFPETVERVANCIALCLMTFLMCMLCGNNGRPTPLATSVTLISIWLILPWYSGLQSLVFQTNYVWGSAIMCGVLLLWPRMQKMNSVCTSLYGILMFIAGWWHEGFGLAIFVLLGAETVFSQKGSSKRSLIILGALLLGLFFNMICGTARRIVAHDAQNGNIGHFGELMVGILLDIWPVVMACLLTAIVIFRNHDSQRLAYRHLAPWWLAIVLLTTMPLVLGMYERTFWPVLVLTIIYNVYLLRFLFHLGSRLRLVVVSLTLVGSVFWFKNLVECERNVRTEYDSYYAQLSKYRAEGLLCNVVYGKTGGADSIPWYLLGIPDAFQESFEGTRYLAENFGLTNTVVVVLPDSLRGRKFDQLPVYVGTAGARGVWPYILTADSISHGVIKHVVGAPDAKMHPIWRLLAFLKGDSLSSAYPLNAWRFPVTMPDGEEIYVHYILRRPRSKRYRQLVALDYED